MENETMKIEFTNRNFALAKFKDRYGERCSIQDSSSATENCIWLGCEHETLDNNGQPCGARMHVDIDLARELIVLLQRFIDNGTIAE